MSCNGCRVLRKGCNENCVLKPCLEGIESPAAQGYATLFLSKFYGRSDLLAFVAAVPENKRSALFQSLLFEACGRIVNPVHGAVGLITSGNLNVCTEAVATVLAGGIPKPNFYAEPLTGISLGGSYGTPSYWPYNPMHGNNINDNIGIVFNEANIATATASGVSEVSPAAADDNGANNEAATENGVNNEAADENGGNNEAGDKNGANDEASDGENGDENEEGDDNEVKLLNLFPGN